MVRLMKKDPIVITTHGSVKSCKSDDYNYIFMKNSGLFMEWGRVGENEDDPTNAPFPNIADIEISKVVDEATADKFRNDENYIVTDGCCTGVGCAKWCYKGSGKYNHTLHMSLKGFQKLADKLPEGLTQIAFGTTTLSHHPEWCAIFVECRARGWAANTTVNGGNVSLKDRGTLMAACSAVAVSVNPANREAAYDTIQTLTSMNKSLQVNIHYMLSVETLDECLKMIDDCKNDPRLKNLYALVLLMFKNKTNSNFTTITDPSVYKKIIDYAEKAGVSLGFDSCSAYNYLKAIQDDKDYERKSSFVTPCCAGRFSAYIDVYFNYHACSFLEGRDEWGAGLPVLEADDFIEDIWNHPRTADFCNYNIVRGQKMQNPCSYFDTNTESN